MESGGKSGGLMKPGGGEGQGHTLCKQCIADPADLHGVGYKTNYIEQKRFEMRLTPGRFV